MGTLAVSALVSFGLAMLAGWGIVRAELRAVGRASESSVVRPELGARLVLSALQAMLALWTIGAVACWVAFGLPDTATSEGARSAALVFSRMTVGGALAFLPFSLVTLVLAVRSIWQERDDGRGVAPMTAAATYLIALFVLYANPGFWSTG